MRSFVKWNLVVLALAMSLAFATGAYADTLSWTISSLTGADATISGSGTITYDASASDPNAPYTSNDTSNGPEDTGCYLVTDISGNITIGGTEGTIEKFLADSSPLGPPSSGNDPYSGLLQYDNLLDPLNSPYLDSYGVVFSLTGFDDPDSTEYPFELCGPSNCFNNNTTALLLDYNDAGDRDFHPVEITVETTAVPEPSVLALLTLGLVG